MAAVSSFPNMRLALMRKIESPAAAIFTSLRGYPERRGEVDTQTGALRHPMQRCQLAAHQLCERVVRLKVFAAPEHPRAHMSVSLLC